MKKFNIWLVYVLAVVSLLFVGVPYWSIPYSEVSLPDSLFTPFLFVVILSATISRIYTQASSRRITVVIGLSVPVVVLLRSVFDVTRNPTSHNLWPFEILIAILIGFLCSVTGVLIGGIISNRLRQNGDDHSRS